MEYRKFRTTEISLIKLYKTAIVPVVLRVYETWSLASRKKNRLRVFGNKVLSKIFETQEGMEKFPQCATSWFCIPRRIFFGAIKSRRIIRMGRVAAVGDRRGAYRILVGNHGGNIPLGRPRRRREDNIKMDLQ